MMFAKLARTGSSHQVLPILITRGRGQTVAPRHRATLPLRFGALAVALLLAVIAAGLLAAPDAGVAQTSTDYDTDNDNLIEITTLAQLNAIRWDLNGDGTVSQSDAANYNAAFPNRNDVAPNINGCAAACIGYELMANLNFDTNGNGRTHINGIGDAGDEYYNGGAGWNPIGGHVAVSPQPSFTATLEGNDHTISNLHINLDTSGDNDGRYVGLFAYTTGTIRNLGLVNPYVKNMRSGGGTFIYYGALAGVVGRGGGALSRVYVSGGQVTGGQTNTGVNLNYAGCLAGFNDGTVSDSYATCDVAAIGGAWGTAGGLVGSVSGTVLRSYAAGTVTSDYDAGGLAGVVGTVSGQTGRISDSYATGAVTTATAQHTGGLVGRVAAGADVIDSYATGAVSNSGNGTIDVGGLAGTVTGGGTTVTGSYATGAVATTGNNNSLGGLAGSIESSAMIASSYATGAVSAAAASSNNNLGGLLGRTDSGGTSIFASYATGRVAASGGSNNNLGGLVGETKRENTQVRATYAAGAVSASGGSNNNLGGLVGHVEIGSGYARISASYASGAVSASGGGSHNLGGLAGGATPQPGVGSRQVFTNTYWDNTASGTGQTATASQATGGSPQSTTTLQTPTEYAASIYAAWNIDVDADTTTGDAVGNDDPWHFGARNQYPILQFGHDALSIARQRDPQRTTVDYDGDNDGLIDITTLAQLDAIRYDLDGNGRSVTGADALPYSQAFPGLTAMMGCPANCAGYELMDDLDFDRDAAYADWTPIGTAASPYAGVFRGNGYSIANLTINSSDLAAVGLFGAVSGSNAVVESLALPGVCHNAQLRRHCGVLRCGRAGRLCCRRRHGARQLCHRRDHRHGQRQRNAASSVGGLVGRAGAGAGIAASYAKVSVTANSTATAGDNDAAGGLVGQVSGTSGNPASVTSVYATGTVSASRDNSRVGGLIGVAENATVSASYWDTKTGGIADDADADPPEGKTTGELKRPTRYTGIYENWNVDVDGDNNPDDPWDFGTSRQYPVLKYGGHDIYKQGRPRPVTEPEEYVAPPIVYNLNIRFSVRGLTLDEGESGSYRVRMTQAPAGHPARVSVESNNSDVVVSPTELVFSADDYDEWQTVTVTVLRDANELDESAHIAHRGPRLSYGGFIVTVNDVWPGTTTETVNGYTITVKDTVSAPLGVTVTAPATLDRDTEVTVSGAPAGTPQSASGYGLGAAAEARMAVSIGVSATPADGLNICLPLPAALAAEAGGRPLTLLRYAGDDGGWSAVSGAQRRGDAVCADGVTEYGVLAAAYVIPDALGTPANLAAVPGAAAGSVVLTWTPAAYAARHFVFGIKQSDAEAGDTSNLAAWTFAERPNVHTITGLESGAAYYFTVTAGRADADGSNEWSPWAPWVVATPD